MAALGPGWLWSVAVLSATGADRGGISDLELATALGSAVRFDWTLDGHGDGKCRFCGRSVGTEPWLRTHARPAWHPPQLPAVDRSDPGPGHYLCRRGHLRGSVVPPASLQRADRALAPCAVF